jgi:uncharacterized protein
VTTPTLTFNGRLPGVDCQPALPPGPALVSLDVAAFVGFAERGPLNVPIAVEDPTQYSVVFGGDVILAMDGGVPVYANLPGAVQAFFDNGGRRCYVVRVAGDGARAVRWLVPGMRLWQPDGVVEDVYLQAAWPGRWSAGYGIGTQLLTEPLAVAAPYVRRHGSNPGVLSLSPGSLLPLQTGDLLRLDLGPVLPGLYVTIGQIDLVRSTVQTAAEVAFFTDLVSPPEPDEQLLLGPDALAALPATLPVRGAWLLQLDLITRQVTAGVAEVLDRRTSLGFNPGAGQSWLDVVQPADGTVPDQTRSMLLRADASTVAAAADGLFLPVGMDQLGSPAEYTDPAAGPSGESGAEPGCDGLSSYSPAGMFLDPGLRQETVYTLLTDADQLTVLAASPRQLRGIHALIGVDEVALISVPDAVHLGWSPPVPPPPVVPVPPVLPPPPDWSSFRNCAVPATSSPSPPDDASSPPPADPSSLVPPPYPILNDPAGYDPAEMVEVHTAVIQLCAARSDVFAVLGVPLHYDTGDALVWLQQLGTSSQPSQAGRIVLSPLSFAGFWHPWVSVVEQATPQLAPLRNQPADGAVCGMIAARELARGAWVAPASVPLHGPVALTPSVSASDVVRLFNAHANLLVPRPGVISALSAHTLAAEPTLLQVSVRRLIILLRKVALLLGSRYVFATNNDRFRQLVRLQFERILAALISQGALAAYQVVTDDDPAALAAGELIVTLLVAPTSPIEFITVSLIRAGEGLLDVVVR